MEKKFEFLGGRAIIEIFIVFQATAETQTTQEDTSSAILLYLSTGWDHSATKDHVPKCLQSPPHVTPALQNQRNCLSDTEQNHLDTKQSIQVWSSTWRPLLSMWWDWNHGAPALLLWALFCQNLGPSWKITYSCPFSPFWRIYSSCVPYPLEIVFNKPHPSILLHIQDATTRKVLIIFLQEIKRDIIYRQAQLQEPRRQEELHPQIQTHLVSVINKISSLLEYQGTLQFVDGLSFLQRLSRIILQAWNSSISFISALPSLTNHMLILSSSSTSLCWFGVKIK